MKDLKLKLIVLVGFIQMVTMNGLANSLPINGKTTGAISDELQNLFTPQGSTFAIWGLIYLLLFVFTIRILLLPIPDFAQKACKLFVINSLLNSSWILAWHYEYLGLSLLIMLGLLASLILINQELNIPLKRYERGMLQLPFSVYFGWITVATIANVTAVLVGYEWNGFGIAESNWALVILFVGILISLSQLFYFRNNAYGAVIIWAYCGIYGKHISESGFNSQYPMVANTAIVGIALMGLGVLILFLRKNRYLLKRAKKRSLT